MAGLPQRNWDAIVLLGPPGSGKSWLGHRLAAEGVARFLDLEPELVRRFGVGETFAANKAEALDFIAQAYRVALGEAGPPLAIESTGLSDADILNALRDHHRVLIARMDTPRKVCVRRVAARAVGENLNNDPDFAGRFHDHWKAVIAPRYPVDLTLTGRGSDIEAVRRAFGQL